ncbi:hypothetical protein CDO73_12145 [Saccharibacillus sp. O23]|uniref:hypothetical protein n=1 Tax=Saccharibacillus sp. O23 TaxID=2009338 RepID=UPI000B4E14B6|nr:hypothetical protein [Saccharibacillus sp. O23]OWR29831.1 hypothetical protein CDO73_12145 [Saccharibacillus sp. O23]
MSRAVVKKTNKAMQRLLNELVPMDEPLECDLFDPIFDEWDDCILMDGSGLEEMNSIEETVYPDRTALEASINHYHMENLEMGLDLMANWEKHLKAKYPERSFMLILSSTLEGEEVVIRFYQLRKDEPEWLERKDLEKYKEEAILAVEVLSINVC